MALSKRIFLFFIIFIIVPLFVLGVASYLVFQQAVEEKIAEQTELTLKAVGRNVSNIFKEANYFSDFWVTTEDSRLSVENSQDTHAIQGIVQNFGQITGQNTGQNTASSGNPLYDQLLEKEKLRKKTVLTYPPIKSVTLYRENGGIVDVSFIPGKPITYKALHDSPIFPVVTKLYGSPRWIGPYEDLKLTGDNPLFTQIRVLLDVDTLKSKGILVIRFQMNELKHIFDFYNTNSSKNQRFMIINKEGTIILDNRDKLNGQRVSGMLGGEMNLNADFLSSKMKFQAQESLVSVHKLDMEDLGISEWSLVSVTDWHYLSGDMITILKWMAGIMVASLLCALLFNLLFVRRTVRFIVRVVSSMRQVELGHLTTRVAVKGNDETTILARGFNSMVEQIAALLDDVKREHERKNTAELMLMQAQIQPHFLFNVLESINMLATQNEGKKVSQMVHRLANILRISIHQKDEIQIKDEVEHLRSYLEIQKFRFEDLFEFEIDIPLELEEYLVLKLTLQPLVENSLEHGFEGITYMGKIRVSARIEHGCIVFYIEDNGLGMSAKSFTGLQYKTETSSSWIGTPEDTGDTGEAGGLGLSNVADRIRIRHGKQYGIFVCSEPGKGTKIKCVIPMRKEVKHESIEAKSIAH
jgi:two-component system, sensor histidine kinase YesM